PAVDARRGHAHRPGRARRASPRGPRAADAVRRPAPRGDPPRLRGGPPDARHLARGSPRAPVLRAARARGPVRCRLRGARRLHGPPDLGPRPGAGVTVRSGAPWQEATRRAREAYGRRAAEYAELVGTMEAAAAEDRALVERWAAQTPGPLL